MRRLNCAADSSHIRRPPSSIMKNLPLFLLLAALLSAPLARTQAPAAPAKPIPATPTATPAATPFPLPVQAPDVPAVKYDPKTGQPNAGFLTSHEKFVAIAKEGQGQLLFLGDSITAGWGSNGQEVWAKSFDQWQPVNFGIGGDRTQHVLWRIENGELPANFKPKAAVLMIGTNNVNIDPAEAIARGITKIVETIHQKTPTTKLLLLAVFPRGEKASTPEKPNAARDKLAEVNKIIAKLADDQHVFFLDIGPKFLQPDGSMSTDITKDFLHFNAAGYQIWADAITPKLAELMK
jgi:lysophospholipase L1-like esterase